MVAMTGDKLEEVAVDMDRMAHHSVVDQIDPNPLTFDEGYWFVNVRHLLTVERPHEPLHVAGEMDVEAARGRTDVGISSRSEERRVGKECVSTCRFRGSQYH